MKKTNEEPIKDPVKVGSSPCQPPKKLQKKPSEETAKLIGSLQEFGGKMKGGTAKIGDVLKLWKKLQGKAGVSEGMVKAAEGCMNTLEELNQAPETAKQSQDASITKAFADRLGISIPSLFETPLKVLAAMRAAAAGTGRLTDEQLAIYDTWLFANLNFEEARTKFPELLKERCSIAVEANDAKFFISLGKAMSTQPKLSSEFRLQDLQLSKLQDFMVQNWVQIQGWEPAFGLCEFTEGAMADYISWRLDESFSNECIKKARQRLNLRLAPNRSIRRAALRATGSQFTLTLKGGQTLIHKVSRLSA